MTTDVLPALHICQQARLSRDARFDGLFYIAVKSTGIYCRPVCPARAPAESQVQYFASAAAAAAAGYRPCLRCRPDSAPGSPAWLGNQTSLRRALALIQQGALSEANQAALCARLGISERYLRKLFAHYLGVSPKQYALYQQVLFAKQLLHQTRLPVTDIAAMAGFQSLRRFHDAFKQQLKLTPTQVRRERLTPSLLSAAARANTSISSAVSCDGLMPASPTVMTDVMTNVMTLELSYRPPLAWAELLAFWQQRTLTGLEWVDQQRYGRWIDWPPGQGQQHGWFEVSPVAGKHALQLRLQWSHHQTLLPVVQQIRRLLDLDADLNVIAQHLQGQLGDGWIAGLRIPGVWSAWEAGVRAILGQQVSIAGARAQLNRLLSLTAACSDLPSCQQLCQHPYQHPCQQPFRPFPTPAQVSADELLMLKVPSARRQTLKALAAELVTQPDQHPSHWLAIKGIGPWTIGYACMRGLSETDIWLGGDLGIQKAMARQRPDFDAEALAPWRSYATIQLWFGLANPTPTQHT